MARTAAPVDAGTRDRWFSDAVLARAVAWRDDYGPDYATRLKGAALLRAGGRAAEAAAAFREAAADDPTKPHAFYELGDLLLETGDAAGALAPLREAVRLSPESAGVRTAYADALLAAGRVREAVEVLRQAASLSPDDPDALGRLAGILAAHPRREVRDPAEALRIAERLAAGFSFREPRSLDVLGAAYAANGDFEAAAQAAERAAAVASSAGDAEFGAEAAARAALYRAGRPYIGPLPAADRARR